MSNRFATKFIVLFFLSLTLAFADAEPSKEFRSVYRGATLDAGYQTGTYGLAILGNVGVQTAGVKTFSNKKLVLQWNGGAYAAGGYAGSSEPGHWLLGARLNASGEIGSRTDPASKLSTYVGLGGKLSLSAMALPELPISKYETINNFDGLVGVQAFGAARESVGGSYINGKLSVLVTPFVQAAVRAPTDLDNARLYIDLGIHAEADLAQNLKLVLEALYGMSGAKTDPVFGSQTEATHSEALLAFRKMFKDTWWLGLDAKVALDTHKTIYPESSIIYNTATPLAPSIALTGGVSF